MSTLSDIGVAAKTMCTPYPILEDESSVKKGLRIATKVVVDPLAFSTGMVGAVASAAFVSTAFLTIPFAFVMANASAISTDGFYNFAEIKDMYLATIGCGTGLISALCPRATFVVGEAATRFSNGLIDKAFGSIDDAAVKQSADHHVLLHSGAYAIDQRPPEHDTKRAVITAVEGFEEEPDAVDEYGRPKPKQKIKKTDLRK